MRPEKSKKLVAHKPVDGETDSLDFEPLADDEAESFAEEFIASATSAEAIAEDARNELAFDEQLYVPYYLESEGEDEIEIG